MSSPRDQRCFRNAGQLYTGDVLEPEDGSRLRHGLGRQIVHAETVRGESVVWGRYTGAFHQDKMTGSGTYRWSDGGVYEGDLLDGRPHGHGKFTWPEGSSYDGLWQEGEMMGQGTFFNSFTGHTRSGAFYRNCLKLHDGTWLDLRNEREEQRTALLAIGAGGRSEAKMPVFRCRPNEALAKVLAILREPPHLVPLVLADVSCPVQPDGAVKPRPRCVAPLWCLQMGDLGCTDDTTVHMAFAAAEKRRKRDVQQIFRDAIREALLTYRPFVLAFGEENEGGNPQDGEAPAPDCWKLSEFFDDVSLPLDLFDLRHFQGSGGPDRFLPREKRGMRCDPEVEAVPVPAEGEGGDAANGEAAEQEPTSSAHHPPKLKPPKAYLLQFAIASLRRLNRGVDDAAVRGHVLRRFSEHMPLHRVAAVVVSTD